MTVIVMLVWCDRCQDICDAEVRREPDIMVPTSNTPVVTGRWYTACSGCGQRL